MSEFIRIGKEVAAERLHAHRTSAHVVTDHEGQVNELAQVIAEWMNAQDADSRTIQSTPTGFDLDLARHIIRRYAERRLL